ncbi:MAG: hypothetical protein PW734_04640 [Verrucomicrobium sp.]|nr:hypothetical protein [Verrucomicrobium sp.]
MHGTFFTFWDQQRQAREAREAGASEAAAKKDFKGILADAKRVREVFAHRPASPAPSQERVS